MSEEKKVYCFCSSNCKYETLTKEQILAAIAEATGATNIDPNAAFITKIKDQNSGLSVTVWVGTQAQYNALEVKEENCLYITTDDTMQADFEKALAAATKAATEAEENANAAMLGMINNTHDIADLKEATTPKNILVDVGEFSKVSGGENAAVTLTKQHFLYVPALGMVRYAISVIINGAMAEGETIQFQHNGNYKPINYAAAQVASCATTFGNAQFNAYYGGETFTLKAMNAIASGSVNAVVIAGWYYCDGE